MIRCGELVRPLSNLLLLTLRAHDVLQMDETRVQVLKEDGRPAKSQSWMWVLRAAPEHRPIVHFHYDPGRGSQVPIGLLKNLHSRQHGPQTIRMVYQNGIFKRQCFSSDYQGNTKKTYSFTTSRQTNKTRCCKATTRH